MITKSNSTISNQIVEGKYTSKELLDLDANNFKMAFGVINYDTNEPLYDTSHVRFQVFLETRLNLKIQEQVHLKFHKCNEEDFDSFFKINDDQVQFKDELLLKQALFCID